MLSTNEGVIQIQTFIPYPNLTKSAQVLDRQRLGKQRVETLQILNTLYGVSKGWENHPAVKMWRGYEPALVLYGQAICNEWLTRGYQDTCGEKMVKLYLKREQILAIDLHSLFDVEFPKWWGVEPIHQSHQSNLLRKMPEHYSKFFTDVPDDLEYVWPV